MMRAVAVAAVLIGALLVVAAIYLLLTAAG